MSYGRSFGFFMQSPLSPLRLVSAFCTENCSRNLIDCPLYKELTQSSLVQTSSGINARGQEHVIIYFTTFAKDLIAAERERLSTVATQCREALNRTR